MDIETLLADSAGLLRQMVAVPSPSFKEEAVSALVASFLQSKDIEYTLLNNNIIAFNWQFCPQKRTLMLCAHLDTVSPAADYEFDPYNPDNKQVEQALGLQDVVAGLGSNDDGASAVSMIAAFRHFYQAELPVNLMLVLSTEEERSGPNGMTAVWAALKSLGQGTQPAACDNSAPKNGLPINGTPDWAIVGEPTGMKAAVAERGLLVIDGTAEGVSGHAARNEGVNALYIALDDIQALRTIEFPKVSPQMGKTKLTVTQINAGTVHNVIPDRCTFVVDIRPTEQYTNPELLAMLQGMCKSTLKARNLTNRSSATREDSPLLKTAGALGIGTFVSPTTSDWMRIDCDAVKMGPGDSARSHHKNEYVTVAEIRDGIEKYIAFIEHFYGNIMEQRD